MLRPLLLSIAIVPLFLEAIATHGTGLALQIGGGVAGALIIMAVAMTLARTLSLAVRANQIRRQAPISPIAA